MGNPEAAALKRRLVSEASSSKSRRTNDSATEKLESFVWASPGDIRNASALASLGLSDRSSEGLH